MRNFGKHLLPALLITSAILTAPADIVTQYGNDLNRNAVVEAGNLPSVIGPDNQLWMTELGGGSFMNVITIWQDKVICIVEGKALPNVEADKGINGLLVLDLKTGEILIEKAIQRLGGGYNADVPYIDEDGKMYLRGGEGDSFICLDLHNNAEVVWNRDPVADMGMYIQRCHGPNGSGFLIGDHYWIPTCATGLEWTPHYRELGMEWPWAPKIMVMNKNTGEPVAMDDLLQRGFWHGQWSSLVSGVVDGERLVFYGDGYGIIHAFKAPESFDTTNVAEGDLPRLERVWWLDANPYEYRYYPDSGLRRPYQGNWDKVKGIEHLGGHELGPCEIISTPTFYDGILYVTLSRDYEYCAKRGPRAFGAGGIMAIDPKGEGDITESNILWMNKDLNRTFNGLSITEDLIFIADLAGQLNCFDRKTGEKLWQQDIMSKVWNYGQVVADGKVFVQNSTGFFYILKAAREKELLCQVRLLKGSNGPMSGIADGVLIVATGNYVAAYHGPD